MDKGKVKNCSKRKYFNSDFGRAYNSIFYIIFRLFV